MIDQPMSNLHPCCGRKGLAAIVQLADCAQRFASFCLSTSLHLWALRGLLTSSLGRNFVCSPLPAFWRGCTSPCSSSILHT